MPLGGRIFGSAFPERGRSRQELTNLAAAQSQGCEDTEASRHDQVVLHRLAK